MACRSLSVEQTLQGNMVYVDPSVEQTLQGHMVYVDPSVEQTLQSHMVYADPSVEQLLLLVIGHMVLVDLCLLNRPCY